MSGPSSQGVANAESGRFSSRSQAVLMLQVFALAVMVIPSDTVIGAIGAGGYPAGSSSPQPCSGSTIPSDTVTPSRLSSACSG